jgi:hypothetical protein
MFWSILFGLLLIFFLPLPFVFVIVCLVKYGLAYVNKNDGIPTGTSNLPYPGHFDDRADGHQRSKA